MKQIEMNLMDSFTYNGILRFRNIYSVFHIGVKTKPPEAVIFVTVNN